MLAIVLSALPILTVILSIFLNWQYYLIKSGDGVKQSRSMKAIVSTSLSKDVYSEYAKTGFANYVR